MRFSQILLLSLSLLVTSCQYLLRDKDSDEVVLPYIKNSADECYYLDDFMPIPNNLVTGRTGALDLRYYTYTHASYKDKHDNQIVLSFYSRDNRCWSLFEEMYESP